MAVVANKTNQYGDVLFIKTTAPAIGIVTLTSFLNDTLGEDSQTFYKKTFRYSLNGLQWGEWLVLSNENINGIVVSAQDTLFLEYRYEQIGDENLAFNSVTLLGSYIPISEPFYFKESIFSKYFKHTDINVLRWYINVTEKLYSQELAKYAKFDDGTGDATDAISFWQSIAKFYSFYVTLAEIFNRFYENVDITNSFLTQRGLELANGQTLIELNYLLQDFSREVSRRGTRKMLQTKVQNSNKYDGELRRLFNLTSNSEFIFDQYLPYHCGWWVDNSSPLYRGLDGHLNAQKFDIDNYQSVGTITRSGALNEEIFNIISTGTPSGFKKSNNDNLININIKQNYCFEFEIEVLDPNTLLNLGFESIDQSNIDINNFFSFKTGDISNFALQNQPLNKLHTQGGYIPIKLVIYNNDMPFPFSQDSLNIQTGNNLIFKNDSVKQVYPILTITSGSVNIRNILFRPLSTEFERGFINMNNFITVWA